MNRCFYFITTLLCLLLCGVSSDVFGADHGLPDNVIFHEAEAIVLDVPAFGTVADIHVSGGQYVTLSQNITRHVDFCDIPFPEDGKQYTIWVYARGIRIGLLGEHSGWFDKEVSVADSGWRWVTLGTYSSKDVGGRVRLFVLPPKGDQAEKKVSGGIDCFILSPDLDFVPKGNYFGYIPGEAYGKPVARVPVADSDKVIVPLMVEADLSERVGRVSNFLSSANCHGAKRHVPEDDAAWDENMRLIFEGQILALLERAYSKPDENGNWWNYDNIDAFIDRAKNKWKVSDVMLFLDWRENQYIGKNADYTDEELDTASDVVMQIAQRYAPPGPLHAKYWILQDERGTTPYWEANPQRYAQWQARLFKAVKDVNPDVLIGGPADAWPRPRNIREMLIANPDVDFIAWNIFFTGRADTPVGNVLDRTFRIYGQIQSSQRISQEVLGKQIPVIVSSVGPNHHAWDPIDSKLATPYSAVWEALNLNQSAKAGAWVVMDYNVYSVDTGILGRKDPSAAATHMLPEHHNNTLYVRPSGYVKRFFKDHVHGKEICPVSLDEEKELVSVLVAVGDDSSVSVVMVNFGSQARSIQLRLVPFTLQSYEGFNLPSHYFSATLKTFSSGQGFFVNAAGEAEVLLPPFSMLAFTAPQQ